MSDVAAEPAAPEATPADTAGPRPSSRRQRRDRPRHRRRRRRARPHAALAEQETAIRVVTAAGGEDGPALAQATQPDVITLDVMMPGMDGWAVLTALKARPRHRGHSRLMLTIVDDKNMGFALGAAGLLHQAHRLGRGSSAALRAPYRQRPQPCWSSKTTPHARACSAAAGEGRLDRERGGATAAPGSPGLREAHAGP